MVYIHTASTLLDWKRQGSSPLQSICHQWRLTKLTFLIQLPKGFFFHFVVVDNKTYSSCIYFTSFACFRWVDIKSGKLHHFCTTLSKKCIQTDKYTHLPSPNHYISKRHGHTNTCKNSTEHKQSWEAFNLCHHCQLLPIKYAGIGMDSDTFGLLNMDEHHFNQSLAEIKGSVWYLQEGFQDHSSTLHQLYWTYCLLIALCPITLFRKKTK